MVARLLDVLGNAAAQASGARVPVPADSFPRQWEYVTSTASMNAVCCSRQCGKTWGARLRTRLRIAAKPGSKILYITLIRKNCRKLYWRPLQQELRDAGVSFTANEVDLILTTDNGSRVEAVGCDDQAGLGKIRGDNYDLVIIDEAQEPASDVLERLVDQVLGPQFITRGGDIDMLGTPPEAKAGYFMDALTVNGHRWRFFNWSMFDAAEGGKQNLALIQKAIADRGLLESSPIYQREYLGNHLVSDPDKLAYEYRPDRNDYAPEEIAGFTREKGSDWRSAMGLDLGFQDSDAIVVVAWNKWDADRKLYVVHTWQQNHQDVDDLADVVADVIHDYRPGTIIGDHGGHGAVKVLETLKHRLHVEIHPKPTDVMVSVGLVNDDLRTGRLLLPAGSELGSDLGKVQRTVNRNTMRVEINKKGYHSDLSEALRYAHHGARHWAAKPPKPPEDVHARRERQWQEQQRREADPWR